jgi:hypothetical protein
MSRIIGLVHRPRMPFVVISSSLRCHLFIKSGGGDLVFDASQTMILFITSKPVTGMINAASHVPIVRATDPDHTLQVPLRLDE